MRHRIERLLPIIFVEDNFDATLTVMKESTGVHYDKVERFVAVSSEQASSGSPIRVYFDVDVKTINYCDNDDDLRELIQHDAERVYSLYRKMWI